jgi:hypothetical protein
MRSSRWLRSRVDDHAGARAEWSRAGETIAVGEVVTLDAGEIRNHGEEHAVGLAFLVSPSEEMMAEGTPAP